jgi:peptide/nickel transport system permease protein
VIFKYAFLPQAGSLLAFLGTQFGQLLGGAFLAEVIFEWPGLGTLLVDSVLRRDFPTFQAALFVSALFALLGTRLGDLLQTLLDPRQDGSS